MTIGVRGLPWLLAIGLGLAQAAPLEDVTLQPGMNSVQATIKMSEPVLYLRHFPAKRSTRLEIYYDRVKSNQSGEPWRDNETREVTASNDFPGFTVTTRDQASQPRLVIEFTREADFTLTPSADGRSFILTLNREQTAATVPVATGALPLLPIIVPPQPMPGGEAAATSGVEAGQDYNQQGHQLMTIGRDALAAEDYESAIQIFNKLLLLPPNQYSQDAQEWVGVARERAGQSEKARAEYQLYLKLYAEGQGAARVRQRLAGLDKPMEVKAVPQEEKKKEARSFTQASITSRYYYGKSDIETRPNAALTTWDSSTMSLVDTSFLNTSIDLTQRYLSEEYDARVVFRDVWQQNFVATQASRNRVNAAYLELKARQADYGVRAGRQSANGGGVMGRFDGISGNYGAADILKTSAVAGQLVDFVAVDQPVFYGVSVERGPASLYLINQSVGSMTDRRAAGVELRYYDTSKTAYAMVDYDFYFNTVTNVLAQGSWNLETGTSFNAMVNSSKLVTLRNALTGATVTSLKDLQPALSEETLRQLALDRTIGMSFAQAGVSQKLDEKWQIGGDLRVARSSELVASGTPNTVQGWLDSIPASGMEYTGTMQVLGRSLFVENDVNSVTLSYGKSDQVTGSQSLMFYNHTNYGETFSVDASLRYFKTNYLGGTDVSGLVPMMQLSYQIIKKLTLEGEIGYEATNSTSLLQSTLTGRQFFSLGLRWEL